MKKILAMTIFLAVGSLCCPGQENVNSPAATEFVRYERIPVSYFNGLPSIEIPVYTVETKDLYLPISLSYHASGIKVNQYPTAVGLGWALNAGGGITRIVNGIPDETCAKDMTDLTGSNTPRDPGCYFSSAIFMNDNWNKYDANGQNGYIARQDKSFVVQHPAYIRNINVDDKMDISFSMSRDNGLSTVQIKRGPAAKSQAPPVFLDFSQSD